MNWIRSLFSTLRRLGPVGPVAVISATLPGVLGIVLLTQLETVSPWFRDHPYQGPLLYVLCYVVLAGLPLLPTYAITALGGWAYGVVGGFIWAITGYFFALLFAYAWLHWITKDRVMQVIEEHPKWLAVRNGLVAQKRWKTILTVALLRLPPTVPFAVVNIVLVSAKVRFRDVLLGSMIGVIPRTIFLVYLASQVQTLDFDEIKNNSVGTILAVATTLVALVAITWLGNRAIRNLGRVSTA